MLLDVDHCAAGMHWIFRSSSHPVIAGHTSESTPPETEAREENSGRKKQSQVASKLLTWLEQSSDAIQVSDNTMRHFRTLGENQIDLENLSECGSFDVEIS